MPSAARPLIGAAALAAAALAAYVGLRDGALTPARDAPRTASSAEADSAEAFAAHAADRSDSAAAGTDALASRAALPVQPDSVALPARATAYSVRGVEVAYSPFSVFVAPGERLDFRAADSAWAWTAPTALGPVDLRIGANALTVFVMEPFDNDRDSVLNGYTVGRYGPARRAGDPSAPPTALLRVPRELADRPVSPSFRLRDFFCRQQPEHWPKYLLLDERLLVKLERLNDASRARGYGPIRPMSTFRTPWYNRSIGNETTYSHHLFGRASDVYVDRNGDGTMDDLDGDGVVTEADAQRLEALVLGLDGAVQGGTGLYAPAAHRGPFVHVDVGGRATRWQK